MKITLGLRNIEHGNLKTYVHFVVEKWYISTNKNIKTLVIIGKDKKQKIENIINLNKRNYYVSYIDGIELNNFRISESLGLITELHQTLWLGYKISYESFIEDDEIIIKIPVVTKG